MTTQPDEFHLYDAGAPSVRVVWCAPNFRAETGALYKSCGVSDRAHFANVNILVNRFASGFDLSAGSFVHERNGYAFKSGTLRFYGVYSNVHSRCFLLTHAVIKRHDKLRESDVEKMEACLLAFDAQPLPANIAYTHQ